MDSCAATNSEDLDETEIGGPPASAGLGFPASPIPNTMADVTSREASTMDRGDPGLRRRLRIGASRCRSRARRSDIIDLPGRGAGLHRGINIPLPSPTCVDEPARHQPLSDWVSSSIALGRRVVARDSCNLVYCLGPPTVREEPRRYDGRFSIGSI